MATRKTAKSAPRKSGGRSRGAASSAPVFPYATRPAALRRFLSEVPKRPKPPKVDASLLASWDIKGGEAQTIIRVLKALGLLKPSSEPSDVYVEFMRTGAGPAVLAQRIREVYGPLFAASLEPQKESTESLRNLFNIHSGGAAGTIEYQIQTFKALCDYADFSASGPMGGATAAVNGVGGVSRSDASAEATATGGLTLHIDLHVHLPENKTSRDYQYIIQDIARFIYRQPDLADGRERE